MDALSPVATRLSREKPVSIAILAMGGQGGGVLADWIVEVAESEGWVAQSTSVPGVAQRTGSTIYYIEALPPRDGVAAWWGSGTLARATCRAQRMCVGTRIRRA